MDSSHPRCPDCKSPMWLVDERGAASHYECFHCPKPDEPQQPLRAPHGLRDAFARVKHHLSWRMWNRPVCDGEHIGPDGVFRKYSLSTPGGGAQPVKTRPMPTDATRQYSFVYCPCGHPNSVHNAKPDDKISFFCKGCGHPLNYQPDDVRQRSVSIPLLSLRDSR